MLNKLIDKNSIEQSPIIDPIFIHLLQLFSIIANNSKKMLYKLFKIRVPVILKVKEEKLTYLEEKALNDLFYTVEKIEHHKIEGNFIETGCALGGSSIVICKAKKKTRPFLIYDVFGMIPEPGEKDGDNVKERFDTIKEGESVGIDGDKYYGYEDDLLSKVVASFNKMGFNPEQNKVTFVKGLYQETLKIDYKVAFAHIDCDWYNSVMTCLKQIVPRLSIGGCLVIDDYYYWAGCKKAVDEYFRDIKNDFDFIQKSRLHIIKR